MARKAPSDHQLAALTAEVARLRDLERHLRRERERVRAETAAEIQRLQAALREAAGHAEAKDRDLERRAEEVAEREEAVARQEQDVAEAARHIREADVRLEDERRRLRAWRKRLEDESERLAAWERSARAAASAEPRPATFDEGLRRLTDAGGAAPGSSW